MTRQVVWPAKLDERRAAALAVLWQLRAAESAPPGAAAAVRVEELRAELAGLPCPHWDMRNDLADLNDWVCQACGDVITPEWVPLAEQEHHLRTHLSRRVHL